MGPAAATVSRASSLRFRPSAPAASADRRLDWDRVRGHAAAPFSTLRPARGCFPAKTAEGFSGLAPVRAHAPRDPGPNYPLAAEVWVKGDRRAAERTRS